MIHILGALLVLAMIAAIAAFIVQEVSNRTRTVSGVIVGDFRRIGRPDAWPDTAFYVETEIERVVVSTKGDLANACAHALRPGQRVSVRGVYHDEDGWCAIRGRHLDATEVHV